MAEGQSTKKKAAEKDKAAKRDRIIGEEPLRNTWLLPLHKPCQTRKTTGLRPRPAPGSSLAPPPPRCGIANEGAIEKRPPPLGEVSVSLVLDLSSAGPVGLCFGGAAPFIGGAHRQRAETPA